MSAVGDTDTAGRGKTAFIPLASALPWIAGAVLLIVLPFIFDSRSSIDVAMV